MTDGRSVLAIAAHPDDEVLGVGGTLAKHAAQGDAVAVLIVTEGSTAQYNDESMIETKKEAARGCAEILGIDQVRFGELPDMQLDDVDHTQVNAVIDEVITDLEPDIVYTHTSRDVNKDHQAVHESTLVATRPPGSVERVLAYEVPSATEWNGSEQATFHPSVFVDISDTLKMKLSAFAEYESEVREFPHPRSKRSLRARATTRGTAAGFEAAEAFSLVTERLEAP